MWHGVAFSAGVSKYGAQQQHQLSNIKRKHEQAAISTSAAA